MARFGGNEFTGFSVPLVFEGRYFIIEPGDPPMITVFAERNGQPMFEVLRNRPAKNPLTDVTATRSGIVAVRETSTKKFLYKIRPGSETSVALGILDGSQLSVLITDRMIVARGNKIANNTFVEMAGVVIEKNGTIGIGVAIPPIVLAWLKSQ